jgi:hypothetical protein
MTPFNTYLTLCAQVYDLSKPTAPGDAYEFYRSFVVSAEGPILEPMCGTGRFLLPLIAEGFDVHGFDASQAMLDALQIKAKAQNLTANVWQALVRDLEVEKKYKLIFIPSGSFGLLTDMQEAKDALKTFYELLEDEGKLVFEIETPSSAPTELNVWRGSLYPREDGKLILANFLDLPLENNILNTVCRYELIDNNAIIKSEVEILKVRLFDPEKLRDDLIKIGFNEVKTIKAFDHNKKPDQGDAVIVLECKN